MERNFKALDFGTHNNEHSSIAAPTPNPATIQTDGTDANHTSGQYVAHVLAQPLVEGAAVPDASQQAKAVRLLWCDTAGIRRCRVVSGRRYAALQGCGLGITAACMAMPAFMDSPAPHAGLTAVGEARMRPVESTRVTLPWCPEHQLVLVQFDAPKSDGPWDCCPRRALRHTCKMLYDNFRLCIKVGFELEFLLLEAAPAGEAGLRGSGWRPVDAGLYCQSSALDRQAKVLDGAVEAMAVMGIEVLQWHKESAPGQYEVALMYGDPVDTADKVLLAKEALVGVARGHGLAVSFLPKPSPDAAGSGMHVHFSLWRDGCCLMHNPHGARFTAAHSAGGLEVVAAAVIAAAAADVGDTAAAATSTAAPAPSAEMLSFLAGVLLYMPHVLPFTAPAPNSYERLRPGAWAGAHAAWGWNNREVPLRVTAPGPRHLEGMHVEFKGVDGAANPYLALSAVLVAGMLGLFAQLIPPEPCQVPPAELATEAAARLRVCSLPGSLREALDALKNTPTGEGFKSAMAEAISPALLTAFLAVREAEAQQAPGDDPRAALLRYS